MIEIYQFYQTIIEIYHFYQKIIEISMNFWLLSKFIELIFDVSIALLLCWNVTKVVIADWSNGGTCSARWPPISAHRNGNHDRLTTDHIQLNRHFH